MTDTVRTDRAAFRELAAAAPDGARVPVERRITVADPFDAYRRARDGPGGVFLETTGGQPGWGTFGVDPVERLQVSPDAVLRDPDAGTGDYRRETPTLEALEGLLAAEDLVRGDCTIPYPCGAIGWLSYDVARELEDLSAGGIGCGLDGTGGDLDGTGGGLDGAGGGLDGAGGGSAGAEHGSNGGGAVDDRGLPRLQVCVFDRLASWECPTTAGNDANDANDANNANGTNDASDASDEGDSTDVTLHVTVCPRIPGELSDPESDRAALDARYDAAVDRADDLIARIETGSTEVGPAPVDGTDAEFVSDEGRETYANAVRSVKEYVREGDTFQANISQRLVAPAAVHPVAAYDALRNVNPAPYSGLMEFAWGGRGVDLVSASPELLLELDGRHLATEPIAGTRPRGDTPESDAALEDELVANEKERAEHAMLVDLERNDLGKVSEFGTVEVSEYRRVDRYSEVMHLVSLVEGTARADVTLAEAIAACFPGGTITGAPKPRTMEIIDELERTRRGPYTGSMAVFGFDGRATLNIVIRTLVRHGEEYHLRVGAGIVHDSDPYAEYDETLAKGRALVNAIDEALEGGEMHVAGSGRPSNGGDAR